MINCNAISYKVDMMEIKTRKQAMIDGENTYFTGKPCKHGHMTYRYVQSGTCYDCINAGRILPNSPTAIARDSRLAAASATLKVKAIAKNSLVQVKLYARDADLELLKATACAYGVMRYQELSTGDVWPGAIHAQFDGGALYKVYAHVDDVAALRDLERSLLASNAPDSYAVAAKLHGEAIARALMQVPPVPDWARVPRPGDFDYK
jgi:hypothetical protein